MNVTICQLPAGQDAMAEAFDSLVHHCKAAESQFVLLPEMPFSPWLAQHRSPDLQAWHEAAAAHHQMLGRFSAFGPAVVAGTRPVMIDGAPFNEAFLWDAKQGYRRIHLKYYLPDEEGFWEASWYRRGPKSFQAAITPIGKVGFLICTELWFGEWARHYAREGVTLLLCPRATAGYSRDKWIAGGRAAGVNAGAFCLSSNRGGWDHQGVEWAGSGWLTGPDGEILAITDAGQPFITRTIDPEIAIRAKSTYPRYVAE